MLGTVYIYVVKIRILDAKPSYGRTYSQTFCKKHIFECKVPQNGYFRQKYVILFLSNFL